MNLENEHWPRVLDGPASEGSIAFIISKAAQEIKEMIVSHAKTVFGGNFPQMVFLAKHGEQIIPVKAVGVYIAVVSNAAFLRPSETTWYGRYNKLICLPNGLYLFEAERGRVQHTNNEYLCECPLLGTGEPANAGCYIKYGEDTISTISRWTFKEIREPYQLGPMISEPDPVIKG